MIARIRTGRRGQPKIAIAMLADVLRATGTHVAAAKWLGVSLSTVKRRLQERAL